MTSRKRKPLFIAAVLCVLLLMAAVPTDVHAADAGTYGSCSWAISGDTLTIRPTNGTSGTMPAWYNLTSEAPPWYYANSRNKVKNIVVEGTVTPATCYQMFSNYEGVQKIDLTGLRTTGVTDMRKMFYDCMSLKEVNVGHLDTSRVTTMEGMFHRCWALPYVDVGDWDTSQVTTMGQMFADCRELDGVDVSGWNVAKVQDMNNMFNGCGKLTTLDVGDWKTSSATTMQAMFYNCGFLDRLDVSGWDVSKVKAIHNMFNGCKSLSALDVSDWNISQATAIHQMFDGCESLATLDVSGWRPSNQVQYTFAMFRNCKSLKEIDVSQWNLNLAPESYNNGLSDMFRNCSSLQELDISTWKTPYIRSASNFVGGCTNLKKMVVGEGFKNASLTNYRGSFPVTLYEIAHDKNNPVRYASGSIIPNGNADLVTEAGKPAVYVVKKDVVLDPNGATGNPIPQYRYYSLEASPLMTFDKTCFVWADHTFLGWNAKADGTGDSYADGQVVDYNDLPEGATVTIYAQWLDNSAVPYKVEYYYQEDGEYGDPEVTENRQGELNTEASVTAGDKQPDAQIAAQKGKKYVLDEDYNNGYSGTITADGRLVLRVYFKEVCTLTLDLNGGVLEGDTGIVEKTFDYGIVYPLPTPSREGYTFQYWEGSRYDAGFPYEVTGDHRFTAQWEKVADDGKDDPSDKPSAPGKVKPAKPGKTGAATGDEANLFAGAWLLLSAFMAMALVAKAKKQ